jgi:hypothetical protein
MFRSIHTYRCLVPTFHWVLLTCFLSFQLAQHISFAFHSKLDLQEQTDTQNEIDPKGTTSEQTDEADIELSFATPHPDINLASNLKHNALFSNQATSFFPCPEKDITGPPPQV